MKKNNLPLRLFFITIFSSLALFSCKASKKTDADKLLEKVALSLQKTESVVYIATRIDKKFSANDTLYRKAICSLYIEPKNEIGMLYSQIVKDQDNSLWHQINNGKQISIATFLYENETVKTDSFKNIALKKGMGFNTDFLNLFIFDPNQSFTNYKNKSERKHIKKMSVHEEVFEGKTPVYVLSIYGKNNKDTENYIQNIFNQYYIRKSDFMPIAHSFYGEFQGMKEYEFTTIEYIATNTLTPDNFTPYSQVEDIDTKVLYQQNKSLFKKDSFIEKNTKETPQKTLQVNIVNNKLPFDKFLLNNGKTLKLSDLKGKVVLLDFWYRGCLPCIKAIPKLNDLQKKYNDKLVVIGINDIDEKDQVTDFLTYKKVNYSSTYKSEINISKSLNFNAFPTIVILDKSGKIAEISSGINERKLKTLIKKLINK